MYEFILPDIGEGVAEAEIIHWLIKPGDSVVENQVIAEVLTDKATVELSSPVTGKVVTLSYPEGAIAKVGSVFATFDVSVTETPVKIPEHKPPLKNEPRSDRPTNKQTSQNVGASHTPEMPGRPHLREINSKDQKTPILAVPAIRNYASEKNIDLHLIKGTGPHGRILRRDIDLFISNGFKNSSNMPIPKIEQVNEINNDSEDWERKPLRGLRRAISQRMHLATHSAALYTYVEEIDMTIVEDKRKTLSDTISPLAIIVYVAAQILKNYPEINVSLDESKSEIIFKKRIHIGVAVDTKDGLVVPVLHDADQKSIKVISETIKDLANRARERRLKPEELGGGTFTISSLGKLGGVMATPILNYPESAILGVHTIRKLPRYINEVIMPRQIMNLSITLDHRLIDGAVAARFVSQMKDMLEVPKFLNF